MGRGVCVCVCVVGGVWWLLTEQPGRGTGEGEVIGAGCLAGLASSPRSRRLCRVVRRCCARWGTRAAADLVGGISG